MAPKKAAKKASSSRAAVESRMTLLRRTLEKTRTITIPEAAQLLGVSPSAAFLYLERADCVKTQRKRKGPAGKLISAYALPDAPPSSEEPRSARPAPTAKNQYGLQLPNGNTIVVLGGVPWEVKLVRRLQ